MLMLDFDPFHSVNQSEHKRLRAQKVLPLICQLGHHSSHMARRDKPAQAWKPHTPRAVKAQEQGTSNLSYMRALLPLLACLINNIAYRHSHRHHLSWRRVEPLMNSRVPMQTARVVIATRRAQAASVLLGLVGAGLQGGGDRRRR
jgi:hypothetical protein